MLSSDKYLRRTFAVAAVATIALVVVDSAPGPHAGTEPSATPALFSAPPPAHTRGLAASRATAPDAPSRSDAAAPPLPASSPTSSTLAAEIPPLAPTFLSERVLSLDTPEGRLEVVSDELLVTLRPGTTRAQVERLAARGGFEIRRLEARLGMARLAFDSGASPLEVASELADHPLIVAVGPHGIMRAAGSSVKSLSLSPASLAAIEEIVKGGGATYEVTSGGAKYGVGQAGYLNDFAVTKDGKAVTLPLQHLQWNLLHMRAPIAASYGADGDGKMVAVLDTGVAYEDHTDESGSYALAPDLSHISFDKAWDFVNSDAHANDDNGHGTQMTGLIAGFGGTLSVAPNAKVMPLKVLDAQRIGVELDLISAVEHAADSGAHVVNMSLAFSEAYHPSPVLEAAIAYASSKGIVMVAASGNDGGDFTPFPAAFPDVIAVGAARAASAGSVAKSSVFDDVARPDYANASAGLDVVAPGGSHSHDLDGDGLPDALVAQAFPPGQPEDFGYWLVSGTSGAAAQVSGLAASLIARGDSAAEVRERLAGSARDLEGSSGFGSEQGAGHIDGGAAVAEAAASVELPVCGAERVYVNPIVVLRAGMGGTLAAHMQIEVVDGQMAPLPGVVVHGRVRGASSGRFTTTTDEAGTAVYETTDVVAGGSGVRWGFRVEAVDTGCGRIPARPVMVTRIDEASLRMAFNLGAGMASSAIILDVDDSAIASLRDLDPALYHDSYVARTLGTGMASSAIINVYDSLYLEEAGLLERVLLLRTHGTGMASSAIILDEALFHPDLQADLGVRELLVRSELSGTGMASSAIIRDGVELPWDHYLDELGDDPGILWQHHGAGMASSAIIYDRSMLNPDRDLADPSLTDDILIDSPPDLIEGAGMASSALVLDFDLPTVEFFDRDWDLVSDRTLGGAGMASSALVLDRFTGDWDIDMRPPDWFSGMGMASSALVAGFTPYRLMTEATVGGALTPLHHAQSTTAGSTLLY